LKKFYFKCLKFIGKFFPFSLLLIRLLSAALVGSLRWFDPPTSSFIKLYEDSANRTVDIQWTPIDQIAWQLPVAVIASEDQQFPNHFGFDWHQIKNAVEQYLDGDNLRGASTISQQTIKNLFLFPDKTLSRKGIEAWLTFWLEITVPKKRILEIYLNIAQFSKSSFGIGAAADYYFSVSPQHLSPMQSQLLATCLPSPSWCQPKNPSAHTLKKVEWIATSMRQLGGKSVIDKL